MYLNQIANVPFLSQTKVRYQYTSNNNNQIGIKSIGQRKSFKVKHCRVLQEGKYLFLQKVRVSMQEGRDESLNLHSPKTLTFPSSSYLIYIFTFPNIQETKEVLNCTSGLFTTLSRSSLIIGCLGLISSTLFPRIYACLLASDKV